MEIYLVYYSNKFTGVAITGAYWNKKAAIRAAMRKVYQLLDHDAKKLEGWTWEDRQSTISIVPINIVDSKDTTGESPLPTFFRYREYLEKIPMEELDRMRSRALNRKKILEKFKSMKASDQ